MNTKIYPDLMIDLETLGNNGQSAIVQIGACYFDINTGEIGKEFLMNIEVDEASKYGEINASTVMWWLQQSKEAQMSVFGPQIYRVDLRSVLEMFTRVMTEGVENVWCHVDFDLPILKHAYQAVGLEYPFKYWMGQHLRTITKLASVSTKDYVNEGIAHNALDDCKFQVKYVVDCFKKLGVK